MATNVHKETKQVSTPHEDNIAAQGSSSDSVQLTGIEEKLHNLSTADSESASPSTEILINYDDYQNASIPAVDKLRGLLIENISDVVILGEGNFTFSVAIASMRGS